MTRLRMASLALPPALRMTWASPSFSPSEAWASIRASICVPLSPYTSTARRRNGTADAGDDRELAGGRKRELAVVAPAFGVFSVCLFHLLDVGHCVSVSRRRGSRFVERRGRGARREGGTPGQRCQHRHGWCAERVARPVSLDALKLGLNGLRRCGDHGDFISKPALAGPGTGGRPITSRSGGTLAGDSLATRVLFNESDKGSQSSAGRGGGSRDAGSRRDRRGLGRHRNGRAGRVDGGSGGTGRRGAGLDDARAPAREAGDGVACLFFGQAVGLGMHIVNLFPKTSQHETGCAVDRRTCLAALV